MTQSSSNVGTARVKPPVRSVSRATLGDTLYYMCKSDRQALRDAVMGEERAAWFRDAVRQSDLNARQNTTA
jgi:hypothetical protein